MAAKKDEEIKLPSVSPVEAVKEHINKREARVEQDKIDKIMQNIERYDGSSNGQIDVGWVDGFTSNQRNNDLVIVWERTKLS